MEKKDSLSKNYIYNLCYQILVIIIPIITTPYLSRVLGAEQIGIHSYTNSIVSCFILIGSLGITLYAQREIAYVQNNIKERSKVFFEMILLRIITIIISMIVYYFTCIINNMYSLYYIIFLIEIVATCFDISWFLQGLEQFKKTVLRNAFVKIISTIFIFLFVKSTGDLYKYILIHSISVLLGNITLWLYIPKYITRVKISELEIRKHLKPVLLLFIPQIALQIYMVLDRTMIGMLVADKSEVGYYEQSQKIIRLLLAIITSLGTVMVPRMANMFATNNKEKINFYMLKSFNFIIFLSIPMMLGLITISDYFVPTFFGEGYEKVSILLKVISPMLIIVGLNNVTGVQFLLPTKRQKEFTIAVLIGAIINFILNLIFIPIFKSIGASFTSLLAETVVLIIELIYCRKYVNVKEIIKFSTKKIFAGIIMFLIVMIVPFVVNNLITLILKILIGILIYLIILWIMKDDFLKFLFEKIMVILKKQSKKLD